jgi:hypothetical protein
MIIGSEQQTAQNKKLWDRENGEDRIDRKRETVFIFVKRGMGASVRDLTSQAIVSSTIIERECLSKEFSSIDQL